MIEKSIRHNWINEKLKEYVFEKKNGGHLGGCRYFTNRLKYTVVHVKTRLKQLQHLVIGLFYIETEVTVIHDLICKTSVHDSWKRSITTRDPSKLIHNSLYCGEKKPQLRLYLTVLQLVNIVDNRFLKIMGLAIVFALNYQWFDLKEVSLRIIYN